MPTKTPNVTWLPMSRTKFRSMRGPNCCDAKRERKDGDGEHHADDRDHRRRDGDQDLTLGIGTPRADPARERQMLVEGGQVDLERDEEQQHRGHDQDAGNDPQVVRSSSQRQLGS